MRMAVQTKKLMNFLIEDEYKHKLLSIRLAYGTGNKSEVLRKLIHKEYNSQIINNQQIKIPQL